MRQITGQWCIMTPCICPYENDSSTFFFPRTAITKSYSKGSSLCCPTPYFHRWPHQLHHKCGKRFFCGGQNLSNLFDNAPNQKSGSTFHAGVEIHILSNFVQKFTYCKSQFSQNSPFWNLIFHQIHMSKTSIFTKCTFLKPQFSQNSHFWNLIFHKIHIFEK